MEEMIKKLILQKLRPSDEEIEGEDLSNYDMADIIKRNIKFHHKVDPKIKTDFKQDVE